ncbi:MULTISPECIES: TVP38/TMEM64 family protein [unclassified Halomonas]|uniref:TVP38/TMEM64 family protein n=1 Tax=unclassified Halomonas TaxID=2609666 RepID=UPI0020A130FA|nr:MULTISPECIES: VTT domain-containing protein [unclassified Halomonas]MCP1313207.1 VTT domain-containing protein [Halomonas sp. 707D7]MCP1326277.1 VTT domain-containing protein [Halomonas sp. 707D4]
MSRTLVKGFALLLLLVALGVGWHWLEQSDWMSTQRLNTAIAYLGQWQREPWMFAAVILLYNALLLLMFPLTVLVVATAVLFGTTWGFGYALLGTLSFSVLSYWVGHWLGREALMRYGGRHLRGLSGYLSKRGVRTMIVFNLLPIAPFIVTNMLAGAFHLRFRDYMLGSIIGIVPWLVSVIFLGSQLGALFTAGDHQEMIWALAGVAVALVLLWGLKRYASTRGARKP